METRVPAVYLKMTDNTRQKLADSFSEGTFQMSLLQLDSSVDFTSLGMSVKRKGVKRYHSAY